MKEKEYQELVKKYEPKEEVIKNAIIAFLTGGLMGLLGEGITEFYMFIFNISNKDAIVYMIITLIFLGCLFTCLGWFDKIVNFAKCGLIIPITGFAHSMQSAALEYKKEGLVTGIGANMFKLAGSVIIFGIVSAYILGLIRLLIGG